MYAAADGTIDNNSVLLRTAFVLQGFEIAKSTGFNSIFLFCSLRLRIMNNVTQGCRMYAALLLLMTISEC